MCLGLPGRIIDIDSSGLASVDFWGDERQVRLGVLQDTLAPGDYIVAHCGDAVRKISPDAVDDTLGLYEILLSEAGEDPIVAGIWADLTGNAAPRPTESSRDLVGAVPTPVRR
jgi:hydrogenase expression/formation protein HypC